MIESRSVHRVEDLVSEIAIGVEYILATSGEFTHQTEGMLSALDTLPPELIAKRNAISSAWAGVNALAERVQRQISELEPFINQARRDE